MLIFLLNLDNLENYILLALELKHPPPALPDIISNKFIIVFSLSLCDDCMDQHIISPATKMEEYLNVTFEKERESYR